MLLIKGSKLYTFKIFSCAVFVLCIPVLSSGCQTIDHQSSDKTTPNPTLSIEQDHLGDRIAELARREEALAAREIAVSSRESEVVTVLAELLKQKEQLEQQQLANQPSITENTSRPPAAAPPQVSRTVTRNPQPPANTPATAANTAQKADAKDKRKVLGGLENIYLDPPGIILSARIDTGAQTSSLNALDMVEFERDGKPYVKFNIIHPNTSEKIELTRRIRGHTKIKKHVTESQRRPIVSLRVKLGDLDEHISFTLVDRSKFQQQVLIGRNFLRDLAIVDVSKEYTVPQTSGKQP